MTKIADMGPDLVYVGATVENNPSKMLLDMRSLMPADKVIFLGADGLFNQAFIDGAGDAAKARFITFAGLPPADLEGGLGPTTPSGSREIVGHTPDAYSTYSYDGTVAVTIQAIDKVRREGPRQDPGRPDGHQELQEPRRQDMGLHRNGRHRSAQHVGQRDQAQRRRQARGSRSSRRSASNRFAGA